MAKAAKTDSDRQDANRKRASLTSLHRQFRPAVDDQIRSSRRLRPRRGSPGEGVAWITPGISLSLSKKMANFRLRLRAGGRNLDGELEAQVMQARVDLDWPAAATAR